MLLKKLAKVRRTILWCAAFAVSHLAFGAADCYFKVLNSSSTNPCGGWLHLQSSEHGTIAAEATDWVYYRGTDGQLYPDYISEITVSASSDVGYSLEKLSVSGTCFWNGDTDNCNNACRFSYELTDRSCLKFEYTADESKLPIYAHGVPDWKCHVTPVFTANVYRVKFDLSYEASDTTSTPDPIYVTFDSPYGELPTPVRDNYTFEGWVPKYNDSDEKEHSDPVTSTTVLKTAADHWLVATWKPYPVFNIRVDTSNVKDVKYLRSGDNVAFDYSNSSIEVISNSVLRVWGTPVSDGYRLETGSVNTPIVINPVEESQTIKLIATPNTYTVRLALNGGVLPEGVENSLTVTFASSYGTLPTPTRVGYDFVGWFLGDSRVIGSDTVTIAKDHELAAKWTMKSYPLTTLLTPEGKGSITRTPKSDSYFYQTSVTLTAVPATGYSFDRWGDDATLPATRTITIRDTADDSDANKYSASFKPNEYTVSFDSNGVNAEPSFTSRLYTYDAEYGELPSVSHIEYKFLGWFTEPNDGAQVETTTCFQTADSVTLYAHWQQLTRYPVTLVKGRGVSALDFKRDGEDKTWQTYGATNVWVIVNCKILVRVKCEGGYASEHTEEHPFVSKPITEATSFSFSAGWDSYDEELTEAAVIGGLHLRNDNTLPDFEPYTEESSGRTVAYAHGSNKPAPRVIELLSDISGSGTLSFDWLLQNLSLFVFDNESTLDLVVTFVDKTGQRIVYSNSPIGGEYPTASWESSGNIELTDVAEVKWVVTNPRYMNVECSLDNIKWVPEGEEKTELEKWAELLDCDATEEAVAAEKQAFSENCKLTISFDKNGKPVLAVTGVSAELAAKVKIECREDLSESTWNEHDPAQHSDCRFYRGTLDLDL